MKSPAVGVAATGHSRQGAAPSRLALEAVAASPDRRRCAWSIDNASTASEVASQSGCSARGSARGAEETPERLVARLHEHVRHNARLQSALDMMAAERDSCVTSLARELQRSDAELVQARHATQTLWSARRVLVDEVVALRERVATLEHAAAYRPPAEEPPKALLYTHLSLAEALDSDLAAAAAFPNSGTPTASPARGRTRVPLCHPSASASPVRPPGVQVPSSSASLRASPAALPPRSSPAVSSPRSSAAKIDLEGLLDSELALADMRLRRLLSSASKESPAAMLKQGR